MLLSFRLVLLRAYLALKRADFGSTSMHANRGQWRVLMFSHLRISQVIRISMSFFDKTGKMRQEDRIVALASWNIHRLSS